MRKLFAITFLIVAVAANLWALDSSSLCDPEINRVCEIKAGRSFKHATLELIDGEPEYEVMGGAFWRVSYYRHPHQVVAVLEQVKGREIWWDVYLLGRRPNIRFRFETFEEQGVREFIKNPYLGLKTCLTEARGICDQIVGVKQILAGHLESSDRSWRLIPGIVQAMSHVMTECAAHLGHECGEQFEDD